MKVKFNAKDQMYSWFRVPMKKSGGKTSTWSPSTGKGTFYHSGSIRFVETERRRRTRSSVPRASRSSPPARPTTRCR